MVIWQGLHFSQNQFYGKSGTNTIPWNATLTTPTFPDFSEFQVGWENSEAES